MEAILIIIFIMISTSTLLAVILIIYNFTVKKQAIISKRKDCIRLVDKIYADLTNTAVTHIEIYDAAIGSDYITFDKEKSTIKETINLDDYEIHIQYEEGDESLPGKVCVCVTLQPKNDSFIYERGATIKKL